MRQGKPSGLPVKALAAYRLVSAFSQPDWIKLAIISAFKDCLGD